MLHVIEVTADRVLYFINMSKNGSAPGPDGIPVLFVKQVKFPTFPLILLSPLIHSGTTVPECDVSVCVSHCLISVSDRFKNLITCSTVVLQCYRRQAIPMEQAKIRPSVTL